MKANKALDRRCAHHRNWGPDRELCGGHQHGAADNIRGRTGRILSRACRRPGCQSIRAGLPRACGRMVQFAASSASGVGNFVNVRYWHKADAGALHMSAFDPKRTCHSRQESLRCRVSSAQSGTQHPGSCLKRKSALACMEQKFSCLRLATDNSQA